MKKIVLLGLIIVLTGCAPSRIMSNKQDTCESQYSNFEDVVSCTKKAYQSDPLARENQNTKLYFLKGDQLVQKLKKGDITETDARAEWQQVLVDMTKGRGVGVPYQQPQRSKYCAPSGGGGYVCY